MKHLLYIFGALLFTGCASTPGIEQAHRAKIAIFQAERAEADAHAEARCHLRFARTQLNWARHYRAQGDQEMARMLFERAEADADLAQAMVTETVHRASASALVRDLYELKAKLEEKK